MMVLRYLNKLLAHKWYVLIAGMRLGGIGMLRLLLHDMSKFSISEFMPYVHYPFGSNDVQDDIQSAYDCAWNHHQKHNKHHWQYWILINDDDGTCPLGMPTKYIYEMVADWMGASKAYTGSWCMVHWMNMTMVTYLNYMHQDTIDELFDLLHTLGYINNGHDGWYCKSHELH